VILPLETSCIPCPEATCSTYLAGGWFTMVRFGWMVGLLALLVGGEVAAAAPSSGVASTPVPPQITTSTVQIEVQVRSVSGQPFKGATVQIRESPGGMPQSPTASGWQPNLAPRVLEYRTNAQGQVVTSTTLEVREEADRRLRSGGNFRLSVMAPGHAPVAGTVNVLRAWGVAKQASISVVLHQAGLLEMRVVDETSRPLLAAIQILPAAPPAADPPLWSPDQDGPVAMSHRGGWASFSDVPLGDVLAVTTEHPTVAARFNHDGTTRTIAFSRKFARLQLHLLNEQGQPVRDRHLSLSQIALLLDDGTTFPWARSQASTRSTSEGLAIFDNLSPGVYRVVDWNGVYQYPMALFHRGKSSMAPGMEVRIGPGQTSVTQELRYLSGRTILGRITERGTSNPIEGARVTLTTMDRETSQHVTITSANGFYRFESLPILPGVNTATIRVDAPGFVFPLENEWSQGNELSLTEVLPAEVLPENRFDFALRRLLTISGRVIDGGTSQPLAGVKISRLGSTTDSPSSGMGRNLFPSAPASSLTDSSGNFSFSEEPDTSVRLVAELSLRGKTISDLIRVVDQPVEGLELVLDGPRGLMGVVVDDTQKPVERALVDLELRRDGGADSYGRTRQIQTRLTTVQTNAHGQFVALDLPAGPLDVSARAVGYADSDSNQVSPEIPGPSGSPVTSITLSLKRGGPLGGVVTKDGKPYPHANVLAFPPGSTRAFNRTTGPDGRFHFPDFALGKATIQLYAERQIEWFYDLEVGRTNHELQVGKGDPTGAEAPGRQSRPGEPKGGITCTVRLVDWKTGEPVARFQARSEGIGRLEMVPDQPGVFRITGLRLLFGYSFRVDAPGYAPYVSPPTLLEPSQAQVERTVRLGPGGQITGRVVDTSGKPIPGVTAAPIRDGFPGNRRSDSALPLEQRTNSQGIFLLEGLGAGRTDILLTPPANTNLVTVVRPAQVMYNELTDMGTITLGSGGTIQGTLIRTPGNTPIPDAQITSTNGIIRAQTDSAGKFVLTNLRPGVYTLQAQEYGANLTVGIEDQETKIVQLEAGSGQLQGLATSQERPLAVAVVARKIDYGQSITRYASARNDGRFTLNNMAPGRWEVILSATEDSARSLSEFVTIPEDGSAVQKEFRFPAASLQILVQDSEGKPAGPGIRVQVRLENPGAPLQGSPVVTSTNGQGLAQVDNLRPGPYHVIAEDGKTRRGEKRGVTVTESTGSNSPTVVTLESLAGGGTVVSLALNMADGKAVPSAWLYLFRADGGLQEHGSQRAEDGVLVADKIPAGSYVAQVSALGFSVDEQAVTVQDGQQIRVESVLYPAGALRWALKDGAGKPVVGLACELIPSDSESLEEVRKGTTNSEGVFVVRGLWPGVYTTKARIPGSVPNQQEREVSATVRIYAGNVTDAVGLVPSP
jgi:hypothetical protein